MAYGRWFATIAGVLTLSLSVPYAQQPAQAPPPATEPDDPVRTLVGRLDLERYKATIKGLTQFGDRRQGTERNRAAIDWIEAQLKSYGCTNTERLKYDYQPPPPTAADGTGRRAGGARGRRRGDAAGAAGGGRPQAEVRGAHRRQQRSDARSRM